MCNCRSDAGLRRAASEYSGQHWNAGFARKARASEARLFDQMVGTFLTWREQIKHPRSELAIRFAFVMVTLAFRELVLFNRGHIFEAVLPVDGELLTRVLTTMFLR
jgi:hypothetical protein